MSTVVISPHHRLRRLKGHIGRFSDAGRYPPHDAQRRAVPAAAGKLAAASLPRASRGTPFWSWAVNVLQYTFWKDQETHACPLPPDYRDRHPRC